MGASLECFTKAVALGELEAGWLVMGFRHVPGRGDGIDRPPLPGEVKRKGWMDESDGPKAWHMVGPP